MKDWVAFYDTDHSIYVNARHRDVHYARLAEAIAGGPAPKRTVLFAAWCGEEKGLLGSEWFTDHPLWDLSKIAVCINMDMVGRYRDAAPKDAGLYAEGTPTASGTLEPVARLAAAEGLRCTTASWEAWEQSDHFAFYLKGVPSLHLMPERVLMFSSLKSGLYL